MAFPATRLRRLRQHGAVRRLLCETRLSVNDLIYPLFIKSDLDTSAPIVSLVGQSQWGISALPKVVEELESLKIPAVLLFGIPKEKDAEGSHAWLDEGLIQTAIRTIKQHSKQLLVIADLCFCEYTSHGHCGVLTEHAQGIDVDNDATLLHLVKQAVSLAKAGVDVIAPSGMMDGMVQAIRQGLDIAGFSQVLILSYAVKYASSVYGPFRQAAGYELAFGDRQTYQMNPANAKEALREAQLDIEEGADILMVKPAGYYLDVIYRLKQQYPGIPLCAYQVSGEYAMIKSAGALGLINETLVMQESLLAIKRAGADMIITYFAKEMAQLLLSHEN